jgi:hypothetical protein
MRLIHITNNEVPKIGGAGTLEYQLWVDDGGSLYVQITKNSDGGTLSPWCFPVARYASERNSTKSIDKPVGYDLVSDTERAGKNNNDGAFLKAVLCHLLDGGASA